MLIHQYHLNLFICHLCLIFTLKPLLSKIIEYYKLNRNCNDNVENLNENNNININDNENNNELADNDDDYSKPTHTRSVSTSRIPGQYINVIIRILLVVLD